MPAGSSGVSVPQSNGSNLVDVKRENLVEDPGYKP
jgi:hypothetical protein